MPHQCTDCGRQFDDGSKEMLSGCPDCGGTKFQFLPDGQTDREPTPADPPSVEESGSSVARKVGSAATAVRDFVGSSGQQSNPPQTERTAGPETPNSGLDTDAPSGADRSSAHQTESRSPSTQTVAGASPSTERADASQPTHSADDQPQATTDRLREPESASMRTVESENDAQASARTEVISPDELPPAPEQSGWDQTTPGPSESPEPEPDTPEETERPDLSELRAELNEQFESIKVLEPGQYELNLMELFDREEYIIALQEDGKYTVQVPEHWQE